MTQHRSDFIPINGDPLPLPPGWTDADLPDEPTGPVSPSLRAAAWRAGQPHVDAIGRGQWRQEFPDAYLRGTGSCYTPPEVLDQIAAEMAAELKTDVERMRRDYPQHQAPDNEIFLPSTVAGRTATPTEPSSDALRATDSYRRPQGVPDGYKATGIYCPSQKLVDGADAEMWERLRAYAEGTRIRIEPDARGWQPDRSPFVSDLGSASEASEKPTRWPCGNRWQGQDDEETRARWERMREIVGYAKWTVVFLAFCAAAAWAFAVWGSGGG